MIAGNGPVPSGLYKNPLSVRARLGNETSAGFPSSFSWRAKLYFTSCLAFTRNDTGKFTLVITVNAAKNAVTGKVALIIIFLLIPNRLLYRYPVASAGLPAS